MTTRFNLDAYNALSNPLGVELINGARVLAAGGGLPRRLAPGGTHGLAVEATNPKAFWKMAEAAGPTLVDAGSNGLDGTINNATFGTEGFEDALALMTTGALPLATLPEDPLVTPVYDAPFSLSFWAVGAPASCTWIDAPGLSMFNYNNRTYFGFYEAGVGKQAHTSEYILAAPLGWNHIVVTYNGDPTENSDCIRIYFNGDQLFDFFDSNTALPPFDPAPLTVGNSVTVYGGLAPMPGGVAMAHLAYWDRAITQEEVTSIFVGNGTSAGRFHLAGQATANGLIVPGGTDTILPQGGARPVRAYLSLDNGATKTTEAEINSYDANGLPVNGTGTDLAIDLEITGSAWVGDENGNGPTLVVDVTRDVPRLLGGTRFNLDAYDPDPLSPTYNPLGVEVSDGAVVEAAGGGLPRRITASGYSALVLADSPLAYYRFNGTGLLDSSGNGNDLASLGDLARYDGGPKGGGGYVFHNQLTYGADATTPVGAFPLYTDPFTLELWAYNPVKGTNGAEILSNFYNGNVSGWILNVSSAGVDLLLSIAGFADYMIVGSAVVDMSQAAWYHIVLTYNGAGRMTASNWGLWVNKQAVAQTPNGGAGMDTATLSNGTYPLTVGGRYNDTTDSCYIGSIAEVAIYDTALSAERVAAHYDSGIGSARFRLPGQASALELSVPGATDLTVEHGGARSVRGYLSLDGGVTREEVELNAYDPLGLTIGGTGTDLTIDLEITGTAWVADENGNGPEVTWDAGVLADKYYSTIEPVETVATITGWPEDLTR